MDARLTDFLQDINAYHKEMAAGNALLAFFQDSGADGGNIWFATGHASYSTVNSATTYSPENLYYQYEEVDCSGMDICKRVAHGTSPIRWGWDVGQELYEKGSPDFELARTLHHFDRIRNSLVIPIPTPGRIGASGVSFYCNAPSTRFEKLLDERLSDLMIAGYAAHVRIQSILFGKGSRSPLSARENECLLWLSRGYRTSQIAERLGVQDVTITMHIQNARRKLSAKTREEAVAIAIVEGYITP